MIRRVPAQPEPLQQLGADVGQFAKNGVKNDGDHHHVGLQKFTRIHRQVADTGVRRDGFGDNKRQPHQTEGETHADHNRG